MRTDACQRRRALPLLLLCLAIAGCAAPRRAPETVSRPPAPESLPGDEPVGVLHLVRPGETLWRIARTYGVELQQLAAINGIDDPSRLQAGQQLFIPGAVETLRIPPAASSPAGTDDAPRFLWPVRNGRLLSGFGDRRRGHRHAGIDIGAERGRPVVAALGGRVTYAGASMRGYGKTVILEHDDQFSSLYAHNSRLLVGVGDRVEQGEQIASVGRTGNASANHCHFEIRRRGIAVDPLSYLVDAEEKR
jgi:lipoprotein NlpD